MPTDWNNLIKEIQRGQCAIFLGHGVIPGDNGKPMYAGFCDQMAEEHQDLIHRYYPEENFYLFKAQRHRRKFTNQLDDYYKALRPDTELYRMLAEIPVSLYITISPDNFLEQALGEKCLSAAFNDAGLKIQDADVSPEKPLVYHLFGSAQSSNTLLLSHEDLFDFFKSVLGEQSLLQPIKRFFKEDAGGEVIFLGFSFSKWYVQLLLRLFNLSKSDNELNRTAYLNAAPSSDEVDFAVNHFEVEFIETHIREFITELHRRCGEKGLLRQLDANAVPKVTDEYRRERVEQIRNRLQQLNRLRNDYDEKLMFSDEPKERMKCEVELTGIRNEIEALRQELETLRS